MNPVNIGNAFEDSDDSFHDSDDENEVSNNPPFEDSDDGVLTLNFNVLIGGDGTAIPISISSTVKRATATVEPVEDEHDEDAIDEDVIDEECIKEHKKRLKEEREKEKLENMMVRKMTTEAVNQINNKYSGAYTEAEQDWINTCLERNILKQDVETFTLESIKAYELDHLLREHWNDIKEDVKNMDAETLNEELTLHEYSDVRAFRDGVFDWFKVIKCFESSIDIEYYRKIVLEYRKIVTKCWINAQIENNKFKKLTTSQCKITCNEFMNLLDENVLSERDAKICEVFDNIMKVLYEYLAKIKNIFDGQGCAGVKSSFEKATVSKSFVSNIVNRMNESSSIQYFNDDEFKELSNIIASKVFMHRSNYSKEFNRDFYSNYLVYNIDIENDVLGITVPIIICKKTIVGEIKNGKHVIAKKAKVDVKRSVEEYITTFMNVDYNTEMSFKQKRVSVKDSRGINARIKCVKSILDTLKVDNDVKTCLNMLLCKFRNNKFEEINLNKALFALNCLKSMFEEEEMINDNFVVKGWISVLKNKNIQEMICNVNTDVETINGKQFINVPVRDNFGWIIFEDLLMSKVSSKLFKYHLSNLV